MKFSTKIVLLYSIILLVSFSVIGYIGFTSVTGMVEDRIKEKLEDQAFHVMDRIDRMLFERYADMSAFAADPVIGSARSTPSQLARRLRECQASSRFFSSLSFFDLRRVRRADTLGKNINQRHPVTEYWPGLASGKDFVMVIAESQTMGKAVIYFASRVKDRRGRPFGVVVSRMPVEALYEMAEQTIPARENKRRLQVELLDKDGLILYSSYNRKDMLKGTSHDWAYIQGLIATGKHEGSARHAYSGEEEITAFAREQGHRDFSGNGWILTICSPAAEAFAPAVEQGKRSIVTLSTIGFVIILITFFFSRTITGPIRELRKAAVEIGKGNLDISVKVRSGDEIGRLARAFNTMAQDLKESEKKYKDLVELLPQVVYEINQQGEVVFANHYGLRLFGYDQDDMNKGLHALQMFIPEEQDRVGEAIRKGLGGEQIENLEYLARRKDGSRFPLLLFGSPVIHENAPVGMRGIGIDLTERKRAEDKIKQAEQEWERTFDSITAPIMILDTHHKIIKANKSMADKLDVTPSEAIGLTCYQAVHGGNEPPLFCPHSKLLDDGRTHSTEIYEERLNGHFVITVSPLYTPDGKLYGSVHYAADITERKRAEEEIHALNAELERKVGERTRQLVETQEELVRKEKLSILGQLSGSVGHELRNPLGVINNAVYYLKTVLPGADAQVLEYLNIIKSEVDASLRIIADLLDFSRTRTPRSQSVPVAAVINKSLGACVIPGNVTVATDLPETLPYVSVDPLQMGQVFQNLIMNAVQAMPKGGELRVSARFIADCGMRNAEFEAQTSQSEMQNITCASVARCVEVSITDTGEGIQPENMKKLFQPLFTTKARGVGLGLSVSKRNVEANGGRIEVKSRAGKGTVFSVYVPVAA